MEVPVYNVFDILISAVLAFIMLGIGLSLTVRNFKDIVFFPKAFIIGLSAQMLALPVIAFIIAYFSGLSEELKIGLIILAACPGGTTSGFLTYFFRGNVALSVSLTSVNSFLTIFSIPLVVNLSIGFFMGKSSSIHLSVIETIAQIFTITILPITAGMILKRKFPVFSGRVQKPLKYILLLALGVVFIIMFFAGKHQGGTGITFPEIVRIFPFALLLNIVCMVFSYFIGYFSRLGVKSALTIMFEGAVHNTTLAFLVAGTLLHSSEMVKPALLYAMFSFWTAAIGAWIFRSIYIKEFNREELNG